MLQIMAKRDIKKEEEIAKRFCKKLPDIIVQREKIIVEEKDGGLLYKTVYEPVNLTKKINETSRLVKQENAMTKLQELENVLKNTKI